MTARDFLTTNPLLSDRSRLAILSTLVAEAVAVDFNGMLKRLEMTKGNFSVHASKLEQAGLIEIDKKFVGKIPVTAYRATERGRRELIAYLSEIENLLKASLGK